MNTRHLYPRLGPTVAEELAARLTAGGTPSPALRHEQQWYAPLGGQPVSEEHLRSMAEAVRAAATAADAESTTGTRAARLDVHIGWALHRHLELSRSEAAHDDVWAFLTLVVLPDVALLRFPEPHSARLLGGLRNVLRRVWWRVEVLGALVDPSNPELLGEDEYVQIFERVTLGRDQRLARALAADVLAFTGPDRSEYARNLTRSVLRKLAHTSLAAHSETELVQFVRAVGEQLGLRSTHDRPPVAEPRPYDPAGLSAFPPPDPSTALWLSPPSAAAPVPPPPRGLGLVSATPRASAAAASPRADYAIAGNKQDGVLIHLDYAGTRTSGSFDTASAAVRILDGPLAGQVHGSPSGAAVAVVRALNPAVTPSRNGWREWIVSGTGEPLQSIR